MGCCCRPTIASPATFPLKHESVHATRDVVSEVTMNPLEAQSRAVIAAALIVRGAVEIPALPSEKELAPDPAGVRLRELTDYVYQLVTTDHPHEAGVQL